MHEGVSEGSRHGSEWVTFSSISCRHLSRIMYLLKCVCVEPLHVHLGGESPMYDNSTTGHYSPCRGNVISGTGTVWENDAHLRPLLRRNLICGFD